ncbi:MAG: stage III sporulation protein AD [Clostridia bacterium]|nr:stage III sporulation protein AD [Clostridia bacterium]
MDIFKILAFTLVALVVILIVEKTNKEIGILLVLVASICVFLSVFMSVKEIIIVLKKLADGAGINHAYLELLLKVTGIAYLVEIVKNVCMDAGNSTLASKTELAGKVSIAILAIPLITNVVSLIGSVI